MHSNSEITSPLIQDPVFRNLQDKNVSLKVYCKEKVDDQKKLRHVFNWN